MHLCAIIIRTSYRHLYEDLGECQSSPSAHIAFYPRTAWPENDDAEFEDYDDGGDYDDGESDYDDDSDDDDDYSDYDGGDYDKDNNHVDDDS